ncbi:MAG: DNA-directed RNA polymerase subunit alpha [Paludibacter sp.]|nr:DNA-directed RNA polymerase subunit alpha [Bacteroidales bacterium]MCM1068300.1 DNA-directed RNA polymerase subunit alpha [Prevotella sp.]MCM1354597.1 DNA-directed RNA polymerase subunit alpha [Bacteroides sp.]MCM1442085.1 DNA-directed RNA polymerase subunit alpha [Muribaculum sp.]MCM1482021.1 DNA-directed RNA polymerase subunit alpha [Paludibacter sp.]
MAILDFQKPEKVVMLESSATKGVFEFRPLEPGYGITIGNALRRILISSLEGYAICSIRISGVEHEFATIPGVIDDVTNIILNLKQVRFRRNSETEEDSEVFSVHVSGITVLTAGAFNNALQHFEVLNPDLVICRMDESAAFDLEIRINKGRGYVPADENRNPEDPIGVIATDSIYTPIRNVKYAIDQYRVEQRTDYEKLTLEILTDGSISPKDALKEAAKILIFHFMLFSDEKIIIEEQEKGGNATLDEEILKMRQLLNSRLVDMDLSVRALNCLKAAEVDTLGQLVTYHRSDLLKFRNFGKKSLTELDELLERNNLAFGMDIAKYMN